jgi:hypothetical protein
MAARFSLMPLTGATPRSPITLRRTLGVTLPEPCRVSVEAVRAKLTAREQALFDLLCVAGHLGQSFPNSNTNRRTMIGARDPRKRLMRLAARMPDGTAREWSTARTRLLRLLVRELTTHERDEAYQALRVLLGSTAIGLAPDCLVPREPALLTAWKTVVALFARLYSSTIKPLGRLRWLDPETLAVMRRETARGRARGRSASGMRPGPAGRMLAVDPRLMKAVGKALGLHVEPGYEARYIFYRRDGDFFWPHPDDPEYAVNVLVCLDHKRPATGTGSALLAYRPDGAVERYELTPGSALAVEARGLVHAREPMRRGERMTMLSIAVNARMS